MVGWSILLEVLLFEGQERSGDILMLLLEALQECEDTPLDRDGLRLLRHSLSCALPKQDRTREQAKGSVLWSKGSELEKCEI